MAAILYWGRCVKEIFDPLWNQQDIHSQMQTINNTLRLRQDSRHFPDDILQWIFLNENVQISIKILLKFVP